MVENIYPFRHVLIVTYGRSGSTLLMGLLNSFPGFLILGENYNLFYRLYLASKSFDETLKYSSVASRPEHPWFGAHKYNKDLFYDGLFDVARNFILSASGDSKVNGFKEIRYFDNFQDENFDGYLKFLQDIFPEVLFILNTRNHSDVCKSGWWSKQDPDLLSKRLEAFEVRVREAFEGKENFFEISYESLVSKDSSLVQLFKKLGVTWDEKLVDRVLKVKHSTA